ncbi:MAG: YIP1 family protein [Dehalococcoidia bacterium]|nr:YIP1 family protein [Dehalococcoidia bacterium]
MLGGETPGSGDCRAADREIDIAWHLCYFTQTKSNVERGRMSTLVDRMIRAARLDANLYIEVEADATATRQAVFVVLIYSVCAGIGFGLFDLPDIDVGHFFLNLFAGLLGALVFWLIWSIITYFIGTTLFKGPQTLWRSIATYGELLRSIGFAAAPGVLMIFAFVTPPIGALITLVAFVWMFIAMVVAVRQSLDFTTRRAIGTLLTGGVIYLVFAFILGLILGPDVFVFLFV